MNLIRLWIIILLVSPLAAPFLPAETLRLSLEDAVERALDQSLSLKKEALDLASAEYSARNLWAEIFPGFRLGANLTFLPSSPLLTEPGFSYNGDGLSYSLNFGVSFDLNASIRSSMKSIELAYRTRLLSYENAARQLEIQVIKNFLNLVTMKSNIGYMEESLALAVQKVEKARVARENGMLNELGWLEYRLSEETAKYNLLSAGSSYQNALGEFLALLGLDAGAGIDFEGTVEIARADFNAEELVFEYLPKRPDIIAQRQVIESLEYAKNKTALDSRAPSLSLSAGWNGGSRSGGGLGAPFSDSVSGSVGLTIPVDSWIPGTKQNQSIKKAEAEVEKANLELKDMETSAKTQIRSLVLNLENRWESLGVARMRLEIAARTAEAGEEGFRNGAVEFQELEDKRGSLAEARQQLLKEELDYQYLLLDLAAALNVDWKTLTGPGAAAE